MKRASILYICILFLLIAGFACTSNNLAPRAMPQEYSRMVDAGTASVMDQAKWHGIEFSASGHGHDPGLETYFRQETAAGVRIAGAEADVRLGASGEGSQEISPEYRKLLIEMYASTTDEAQRAYILQLLGATKTPAAATTDTTTGTSTEAATESAAGQSSG